MLRPPCPPTLHTHQVIEKAYKKLRLDALVIQQGRLTENTQAKVCERLGRGMLCTRQKHQVRFRSVTTVCRIWALFNIMLQQDVWNM